METLRDAFGSFPVRSVGVCRCPILDFLRKVGRIYFCYRIRAAGTGSFTGWNESMVECFTQIVYKPSFWKRERQVDLSGEAYFEVSRNKTKPFVVNSNDVRTCVLGTKFNVRARPSEEKVVTTLLKGSVKVQLPGQSEEEGILLKPGQMLSVDTRTMQPMLTEASRPGDVLLWINGKLKFEQATLQEIVQCLEKHFDVHFIISDAQLQKDRFTCTFSTDDDIRQILSILALTKRFDYKCEDNNIILTPKTNR